MQDQGSKKIRKLAKQKSETSEKSENESSEQNENGWEFRKVGESEKRKMVK